MQKIINKLINESVSSKELKYYFGLENNDELETVFNKLSKQIATDFVEKRINYEDAVTVICELNIIYNSEISYEKRDYKNLLTSIEIIFDNKIIEYGDELDNQNIIEQARIEIKNILHNFRNLNI